MHTHVHMPGGEREVDTEGRPTPPTEEERNRPNKR